MMSTIINKLFQAREKELIEEFRKAWDYVRSILVFGAKGGEVDLLSLIDYIDKEKQKLQEVEQ